MKISRIRSQILVIPQADPLASTPEDTSAARPIVILRVDTDDGIEGTGVTFYGGAITASLKRAVDDLGAQLGDDRLDAQRVFADRQRAEIIDGALQRGGDGPTVKGHPDSFDAVIGIDPQDHDRPGGARVFGGIGERVGLRHLQDL